MCSYPTSLAMSSSLADGTGSLAVRRENRRSRRFSGRLLSSRRRASAALLRKRSRRMIRSAPVHESHPESEPQALQLRCLHSCNSNPIFQSGYYNFFLHPASFSMWLGNRSLKLSGRVAVSTNDSAVTPREWRRGRARHVVHRLVRAHRMRSARGSRDGPLAARRCPSLCVTRTK